MPQTETLVSQLRFNELTKTEFNNAPTLSETELYAVDPEFTGGKLLKTDRNGDIVESAATEEDAMAGGTAIQGVQVNGFDLTPDANKKVNVQVPTNNNQLTNGAGYITGITSSMVTAALGYTPYNSTNPNGYQANVIETVRVNGTALTPSNKAVNISVPTNNNQLTNGAGYITSSALNGYATQNWVEQQGYLTSVELSGYATEEWVGQQGFLTGITSSDVTSALGYTPYSSSNPAGYTSNVGTVTSVNNVQPVNGNVTISIPTQVTESTVSGWGFTKNTGTVTSVNNVSPTNGNVSISIPDSTSDLTNDSGFITLSSLSGTSPISYNSNTGAISVANGYQITTTAQVTQIGTNTANITTINSKIPNDASSSNQLADKNFVNSSISSNTANFIGTFNSVAELEAYSGTLTNNDYAFVISQDTAGNTVYNRYKWNGTEWLFEYALNNSSFTADQWASINSTATSSKISQIATNTSDISALQNGKQDNITGAATTITSSDLTANRALVSNSSGKVGVSSVTATELGYLSGATSAIQTQLNGKQAIISDLATIRSGASAGATALQPSALNGYATESWVNNKGYITDITSAMVTTALGYSPVNPSSLATVATSGSYNDLSNKPTIPTVNNPTITLTQGGTTKGSFTLNQSSGATIDLDAGGELSNFYTKTETDSLLTGKVDLDLNNMNPSATAKDTISGWGMPDFTAGVQISFNSSMDYAAPCDGFICVKGNTIAANLYAPNGGGEIKNEYWFSREYSAAYNPIAKGYRCKYKLGSSTYSDCVFYPLKGANNV